MKTARWICETSSTALTCIPEAIVKDKVIGIFSEWDTFEARGTCWVFYTAYFWQDYMNP